MRDKEKTKAQLITEIESLREQIKQSEANDSCQQTEEPLHESLDNFKTLAENGNDGVLILVDEGRIVYANQHVSRMTRYSQKELLELDFETLITKDAHYETILLCKDKENIPVEITTAKTVWHGQSAKLIILRDITERKEAEAALAEERNLLRILIDNLPDHFYFKETGGQFVVNNKAHSQVLGVETPDKLIGQTDFDVFPPEVAAQQYADEQTLIHSGQSLVNQEELITDINGKKRWLLTSKVPLHDDHGNVIGLVGISRDITERKQAEQTVRESETRYRVISELISDYAYAFRIEPDGSLIREWTTDAFTRITGYKLSEMDEFGGWEYLTYEEDKAIVEQRSQNLLAGRPDVSEFRIRTKKGEIRWLRDHAHPIWDYTEGRVVRVYGATKDVTEYKRAGAEMRKLSNALKQTADIVIITNRQGIIEYVNPAFEQITGYTQEEVQNETPGILASGEHDSQFYKKMWETITSDQVFRATFINRRKNGELYYEDKTITPLKDKKGHLTHYISTGRDITQQRQSEKALRKSQASLEKAQRIARLGNWDWNIQTDEMEWSDETYHIYGLTPQQFEGTYAAFLKLLHPDDQDLVKRSVEKLLSGQETRYSLDYRLIRPNDEIRIVHEQTEILFDKNQQPIRMIGTVQDTTNRKRLEERLEAIHKLGRELTLLRDEANIIRQVLGTIIDLLQFEVASYGRVDGEKNEIEYRYHLIKGEIQATQRRIPLTGPEAKGLAVDVIQSGEMINVPDVSQYSDYVTLHPDWDSRSELCVPLKVGDRIIGVLNAKSTKRNYFTEADQQLLQTLADQTAVALENAHLYMEAQHRTRELAALNKASRAMVASLDMDVVLDQAMEEVKMMLEVQGASLLLCDKKGENLTFAAAASPGSELLINTVVPLHNSIAGSVVLEQKPLLVKNAQNDPRFYRDIDSMTGLTTRSLLAVPLIYKGKVIGVVEAMNKAQGTFNEHDLGLMEALASSAAIAIENAQLYEAERTRYRESEALRRAALALTSTIALEQVFERILTELQNVVPYDSASIQFLKEDSLEIIGGHGFPHLSKLLGVTLHLKDDTPNRRVIQERAPVIIDDVKNTHLSFDQSPDTAAKIRSWLGIPLVIGEQVMGVLALDKYQPNFYSTSYAQVAMAYASQAAIAIKNAQLHAETEQRAKQLAVLRELDQAITASLRINDVYHAFAHHAARLLTYDHMSITLLEKEKMRITYMVAAGVEIQPKGTNSFPKTPAINWVIDKGQPLLRHNIGKDIRFDEEGIGIANHQVQSDMIIPLRVKGRVIGTWNIGSWQVGAYGPDDLTIAQSMVDQLAIAIENARLYQAEREQYRRLQQSQAQLIQVEKMAALGRLVASIAHEINNPIQAIQNCMTLLKEEVMEQQRAEKLEFYADISISEIDRIATIVRRMRDFYRPSRRYQGTFPSSGETASIEDFYVLSPHELQEVDLPSILENVLQLANKQMQHNGVSVEYLQAEELPTLEGSPDHLKQVFLNMVLNAIDAMAEKGGGLLTITTCLDEGTLSQAQTQPVIRVEFSDTGEGIPPETLSRLFEPLFTTKEQGSGFGLFISYKIIEAHHGQISVDSKVGVGTAFTILLPLTQPERAT